MGTKIVKMLAGILHNKDACFKCSKGISLKRTRRVCETLLATMLGKPHHCLLQLLPQNFAPHALFL